MKKKRWNPICDSGWKKIFLIMRITVFILFASLLQVSASVYSQQTKLNLKTEKVSVIEILKLIEEQSDFHFLYRSDYLSEVPDVSVDLKDSKLEDVLNKIILPYGFKYEIEDNTVIIKKVAPSLAPNPADQKKGITGTVKDSKGQPLSGVSVVVKGTTTGTVTDNDGKFTLTVAVDAKTLAFSFVGMTSQEIAFGNKASINVSMHEESVGLEEIVSIGYGTQKKATATGAISSVKGEELVQAPTPNLSNSFAGRFPGLTAITSSGEPGNDDAVLRIRGVGTTGDASALVVIDGIAGRPLGRIDANDIESVTILKDASAAIYGAQAANGVILITTKRGKIGKQRITINMNAGETQSTVLPQMANSVQYANMVNEINGYSGNPLTYSAADITKFGNGTDLWGHPNTNWYKAVLKPWSNQNNQNVTFSGGNEKTKLMISFGAKYQDAIYRRSSTNFSQYNFRSNIDSKLTNEISISIDFAGRQENRNNTAINSANIFEYLLRGKPTMNAFWPNGQPGPDIENGMNPAVIATDVPGYNKDTWNVLESNFKLNINIPWIKGLNVTANGSYDAQIELNKLWQKPWSLYVWDGVTMNSTNGLPLLIESQRGPTSANLNEATQNMHTITYNAIINYENRFDSHAIKVMIGNERSSFLNNSFSAFRTNYQSTILDQLFAGGNVGQTNTGQATQTARVSYFGRADYSYKDKYLLEFVCRYDGSNNFAPSRQFGFFPGISTGWRMSEEKFWKENLSFINYFKLRGSLGKTGNDRINPYQYLANYTYTPASNATFPATYIFGSQVQNPLLQQQYIPNVNVTWETSVKRNMGFDAQLLNNRLGIEFDYFRYNRSNILWQANATVPGSTGITAQLPAENMAKVSNKGYEGIISYKDKINNFSYNVSINGSYAKNRIDYIDEPGGIPGYQTITGKSLPSDVYNFQYSLYYQAIGIYKDQAQIDATPHWAGAKPGDIIFKDVNGDGVIDGKDMVRTNYNNVPKFTGGLNIELKYKQFDLSLLFQGASGAKQYFLPYSGLLGNFPKDFADNRWTPTHTDASYPRAFNMSEYWWTNRNTFFLHSTDYLRMKNLVIGYTTPNKFDKLIGAETIRIYISALNLFTLTKFKDFDPEMAIERGLNYPLQRVLNGGITITF